VLVGAGAGCRADDARVPLRRGGAGSGGNGAVVEAWLGGERAGEAGALPTPGFRSRAESGGAGGDSASAAGAGGDHGGGGGGDGDGDAQGGVAGESGTGGTGGSGAADSGADPDFTVNAVRASDIDPAAPSTVGIVTWWLGSKPITAASLEYGLDTSYGTTLTVDVTEAANRTLLLGLKPSRTYHFRISATYGKKHKLSQDYELTTGPVPASIVPYQSFTPLDDAARERGFIVLTYWSGTQDNTVYVIDGDGEVVWWYQSDETSVARATISADGKNVWLVHTRHSGDALERISIDGLDHQRYPSAIGSHDITAVSGSTMAFIEYGEPDCDSIFEIEPSGEMREVFESEGLFDPALCHGNAVHYWKARDVYTFSDRYDDLLIVNRAGAVDWRLSEHVPGGNAAWGGAQHGHQLLADSVLIFANAGGGESASAAIEYSLEGQELMRYAPGYYSLHLGNVQRLPLGNTLVTFSNASVMQELDAAGKPVLEIHGDGSYFGYPEWRASLYAE
jgi:hypothetical protein